MQREAKAIGGSETLPLQPPTNIAPELPTPSPAPGKAIAPTPPAGPTLGAQPEPTDRCADAALSTLTPEERAKLTAMLTPLVGGKKGEWAHSLVLDAAAELQIQHLQFTLFDLFIDDKVYSFERDGDLWKICFANENANVIHETGAEFVAELLKNPNKKIPSIIQEGARGKKAGEMGDCYGDELTIQNQCDQDAGDKELLKELRTKLREIDLELAARTDAGDEKECEMISRRRIDLLKISKAKYGFTERHLLGETNPIKGRAPTLSGGNAARKAFDRVKYHIDKFKNKIEETRYKLPCFADHLRKHIHEYGNRIGYVYEPPPGFCWIIS